MSNTPKNILITGASSGLGAALAKAYATPGTVIGLTGRDAGRLEQVASVCRANGATVAVAVLDITDADAVADWVTAFNNAYPVDLCIANAGISAGTGGGDETMAQVKRIFDVNITGVLHTIHPTIDLMRRNGSGQIAIISSIAGWVGLPGAPAYGASKGAVRIYGQALRGLHAPHGIKINVVCPGFIRTPMTDVNTFPMPFLMEPDQAAHHIQQGLAANKGLIAFPWPQFAVVRLLSMLPDWFVIWFGKRLPAKPVETI